MKTLKDILTDPARHDSLVAESVQLIDDHVAAKSGLKGMGLKTAFGLMKKARPDALEKASSRLLPEFASALEPLFVRFQDEGRPDFGVFLMAHAKDVVPMLLKVADARAAGASGSVAGLYQKLRGGAEAELESALPKLAALFGRQVTAARAAA